MEDKLLTVKEVMEIFKLSRSTVYRLIESKELESVKIGRSIRIKESSLEKYFNERK